MWQHPEAPKSKSSTNIMVEGYSPELGSAALLEGYLRLTVLCMYELIFDSFDGNQTKKQVTDWLLELFNSEDFYALKVCCCCARAMWSLCMCLYLVTMFSFFSFLYTSTPLHLLVCVFSQLVFVFLSLCVCSFPLSGSRAVKMVAR